MVATNHLLLQDNIMMTIETDLDRFGGHRAAVWPRFLMKCLATVAALVLVSVACNSSEKQDTIPNDDPAVLIELLALSAGPAKDADRTHNEEKQKAAYEAADKLRRQGERSHQLLLKHLDDRRLSVPYEAVRYADVGHACYHIIRQQIFALPDDYGYDDYWRTGADGKKYRNPYFYETNGLKPSLFDRSTLKEWLKARSGKSLRDLQVEALSWLIKKEDSIGFQNEEDKKHYLYPLQHQLKKIKTSK
jgi:hypothetical protein